MIDYKTEGDAIKILSDHFGKEFQNYREKWDKVCRLELETDFPLFLHLETSYKCNFHCPMCVQGNPELKEKFGYPEVMTTEMVQKILSEAEEFNCPSISFQGDNEPFLVKEITDWFKMARDHGFLDVMVNSNGSIMSEKLAEKIVSSGLTRLRFSLDAATEETYSKIRLGGHFPKVMDNIHTFLKVRERMNSVTPIVGVNFVKMKSNHHEEEAFAQYWNERVDFIVFQDFMTPDTMGDYKKMGVENDNSHDPDFRCNQPFQRVYIRGNGEVTPCCAMFSAYLKVGSVHQSSLHELWNSGQSKSFRKMHFDGKYYQNEHCLACSKNKPLSL